MDIDSATAEKELSGCFIGIGSWMFEAVTLADVTATGLGALPTAWGYCMY